MKLLSAAALLVASSGVFAIPQAESPSVTKTLPPTIPPTLAPSPTPTTCTCPNPILCCSEIVDSDTKEGQKIIEGLGMAIKGAHIPVGVNCSPHRICPPGMMCPAIACINPTCCFESSNPSFGAVGCVSVPLYG